MQTGTVRWFDSAKGYGFIEPDIPLRDKPADRPDIFVHYSSIQMRGYKTLTDGQRVCFEIQPGEKGVLATDVVPVRLEAS